MFIFCFYNPGSPFSALLSGSPCCGIKSVLRRVPGRQWEPLNSSLPAGTAPGELAWLLAAPMRSSEHPRRARGCGTMPSSSPLLHQRLPVNPLPVFLLLGGSVLPSARRRAATAAGPQPLGADTFSSARARVGAGRRSPLVRFFSLALDCCFSSPPD